MRNINKARAQEPKSLQAPTTIEKRLALIEAKKWLKEKGYEDRYRTKGLKKELENLYYHKCAYCERYIKGDSHVEHYRPKAIYYWLAYSWDNLMLCCENCNKKKLNQFPVENSIFNETEVDCGLTSKELSNIEKPLLINPELDDVDLFDIYFTGNFRIASRTERGRKTIEVCDLNNTELIIQRETIYQPLFLKLSLSQSDKLEFKRIIKDFLEKSNNPKLDHTMFRKMVIGLIANNLKKIKTEKE